MALQAEQACSFVLPPPWPRRCGCATSFLLHDRFCSTYLRGSQKVEQALPLTPQFFAAAPLWANSSWVFWCSCLPQTYSRFFFSSLLDKDVFPPSRLSLAKPLIAEDSFNQSIASFSYVNTIKLIQVTKSYSI